MSNGTATETIAPVVLSEPGVSAALYQCAADRYLGTSGGVSPAFGADGSTVTFVLPADEFEQMKKAFAAVQTNHKNLEAIKLLEEWFAEPDDLGEDFWREFDEELNSRNFAIS